MATTYEAIATVTVGSGGASSIDFTSIPATYTDLVVKYSLRTGSANVSNAVAVTINSVTSATVTTLRGDGTSATSFTDTAFYGGRAVGGTATASTFSNGEFYIPNYAGSNYKSISVDAVTENNATSAIAELVANLYSSSTAISTISLSVSGQTLSQYSTATLYGIKNS